MKHMQRSIFFAAVALIAGAFMFAQPSAASTTDPGLYSVSVSPIDFHMPADIIVDAEYVAVLSEGYGGSPQKQRSLGLLEPVYAESLATDGRNLIRYPLRC